LTVDAWSAVNRQQSQFSHQSTVTEELPMTSLITIRPNCTVICFNDRTEILFSYKTPVAAYVPGRGFLRTDRFHSKTTSRHINAWVYRSATVVPQAEIDALANAR
jgi:hypothetical protein